MQIINQNGHLIAEAEAKPKLPHSTFRFSQGLFESILVIRDTVMMEQIHYRRLLQGIHTVYGQIPSAFTQDRFAAEIRKTLYANHHQRYSRIRFQFCYEQDQYFFIIEVMPVEEELFTYNRDGWVTGLMETGLKAFDTSGNLKRINLPLYGQTMEITRQNNWNDVLLLYNRNVVETGIANIFWFKNGILYTPPLSEGCVNGTMRNYVLDSLRRTSEVVEHALDPDHLYGADEVFATNAIRRIKWIAEINGRQYGHKLTAELYRYLFG